eukprot:PhF_6_TR3207/c0_g1_i2/m.4587
MILIRCFMNWIEYILIPLALIVIFLLESLMRRIAPEATAGLASYQRLFLLCGSYTFVTHLVQSPLELSVATKRIGFVFGTFLPIALYNVHKKRYFRALYHAAYAFVLLFKETMFSFATKKVVEYLMGVLYFSPALHPTLGLWLRGYTAPIWYVIGFFFL